MGRKKKEAGKYISIYLDADQLRVVGDQPAKKVKALVVQAISNDLLGHLGAPLAGHLASQGATASIEGNTVVVTRPGTPVNKYVQIVKPPSTDYYEPLDQRPVMSDDPRPPHAGDRKPARPLCPRCARIGTPSCDACRKP